MNSNKLYIAIGSVVLIFTFFTLYFAFKYEKPYFTIVTDPNFKAKFINKRWYRITKKLSVNEEGFEVYDEKGYVGNCGLNYLSKINRWVLRNDRMAEVKKFGEIVAYKSNMKYEIKDMVDQDITSDDKLIIQKELEKHKIITDINLAYYRSIQTDLNGDKDIDKILVSNLFHASEENNDAYSIILGIIDDKVYTIYFNGKLKDNEYSVMHANVKSVFDLKKDNKVELLITANSFGQASSCSSIYEMLKDGPSIKLNC